MTPPFDFPPPIRKPPRESVLRDWVAPALNSLPTNRKEAA